MPWIALIAWVIFALAVPRAAQALNAVKVFGFPLGYLMMAQASLIALLLIGALSARSQNRRERSAAEPN